jgi:hypothetical protein
MKLNEMITKAIMTIKDMLLGDANNPSSKINQTGTQSTQTKLKLDTKVTSYAGIMKMTKAAKEATMTARESRQTVKSGTVPVNEGKTVYGELFPTQEANKEEPVSQVPKERPKPDVK